MPLAPRLTVLLLLAPSLAAGCASESSLSPVELDEGFEDGLDAWTVRSDLTGGAAGGRWSLEPTRAFATEGDASLNVTVDARQRDGAVWIDRTVEIPASPAWELRASLDAWSPSAGEDPHARLLLRVGPQPPGSLAAFPSGTETGASQEADATWGTRVPLDRQPGWDTVKTGGSLGTVDADSLTVSLGIEIHANERLHYVLDDLEILLVPEPIGRSPGGGPV